MGPLLTKHFKPDLWKVTTIKTPEKAVLYTDMLLYMHHYFHGNCMYAKGILTVVPITNQLFNVLTEVVPYYKSAHIKLCSYDFHYQ